MGCTYNVVMANSQGKNSDVVDETTSTQADVKPQLELHAP